MKILTKEEEQAHYNATLKGGSLGGLLGLGLVCCLPGHLSASSASSKTPLQLLTLQLREELPRMPPTRASAPSETSQSP